MRPPPAYPATSYPFLVDGGLAPDAQENAIVSTAMRYLGVPYKWGSATPKTGFDCSGLVQYVFARLGVLLPHSAAEQYHFPGAVWVAPNRLQPGDLVFFVGPEGTRKEPGHVGIYIGDGYLIDAPHTGSSVRVDSLDEPWFANEYVGGKEIVGASLAARRLANLAEHAGFGVPGPVILRQRFTAAAVGASLPPISVDPTAAHTSAPRQPELWAGGGSVGVLLLLAGVIQYRRRGPRAGRGTKTRN